MNIQKIESVIEYAKRLYPDNGTDKVERYQWKTYGSKSDWDFFDCWALKDLKINHNYQREQISSRTIDDITKNFDYNLFMPILVNMNTMCIIDGGHRCIAAARRGLTDIPVKFFKFNETQEAEYFLKWNEKKNCVSAIDKFRAKLWCNDKNSLAIQAICKSLGITISKNHGNKGQCQFISNIEKCANKSLENTRIALAFTRDMAKDEALSNIVFSGAFDLQQHGIFLINWVDKCYMAGGQKAIISNYKEIKIISQNMGVIVASREAILKIINKGLRKNKVTINQQ